MNKKALIINALGFRGDVYAIAGNHNRKARKELLEALLGHKVLAKDTGINKVRQAVEAAAPAEAIAKASCQAMRGWVVTNWLAGRDNLLVSPRSLEAL